MNSLEKRLADLREQIRKYGCKGPARTPEEIESAVRHIQAHADGRCECDLEYDLEAAQKAQAQAFGGKRQGLRVVR